MAIHKDDMKEIFDKDIKELCSVLNGEVSNGTVVTTALVMPVTTSQVEQKKEYARQILNC